MSRFLNDPTFATGRPSRNTIFNTETNTFSLGGINSITSQIAPPEPPKKPIQSNFQVPFIPTNIPEGNGSSIRNIRIYEQVSGEFINFKVAPEISEAASTNYIEISEIRQAASILVYLGSPSRNFNINAKLVSRTTAEADQNFKYLNLLKSWSKPTKGATRSTFGEILDTDVPSVLYLYGYGKLFKGIQVVMKSINVEYQTDCDAIYTSDGVTKMPIILPVSLSFQEIRSAKELKEFDIQKYKNGILEYW